MLKFSWQFGATFKDASTSSEKAVDPEQRLAEVATCCCGRSTAYLLFHGGCAEDVGGFGYTALGRGGRVSSEKR